MSEIPPAGRAPSRFCVGGCFDGGGLQSLSLPDDFSITIGSVTTNYVTETEGETSQYVPAT